jgi:hypothetical protein
MRFNSKLDKRYKIFNLILSVLLFGTSIISYFIFKDLKDTLIEFVFSIFILGLIYFINKSTYYIIEGNELICKSLFLKRKIEINSIRKIEKSNSLGSIYKIATAFHGLSIHYNKFDDVFISPENHPEFCKLLNEQNPSIQFLPEKEFHLNS